MSFATLLYLVLKFMNEAICDIKKIYQRAKDFSFVLMDLFAISKARESTKFVGSLDLYLLNVSLTLLYCLRQSMIVIPKDDC